MCKDALHLGHAFRHCLTIGLPQVGRVYARGNRFAASALTRRAPSRAGGGWPRRVAEHAPAHGLSRIPHDSVRQGMLGWNVRRGMLGATKLARRTRRKRHEHASAHANTVAQHHRVRSHIRAQGHARRARRAGSSRQRVLRACLCAQLCRACPHARNQLHFRRNRAWRHAQSGREEDHARSELSPRPKANHKRRNHNTSQDDGTGSNKGHGRAVADKGRRFPSPSRGPCGQVPRQREAKRLRRAKLDRLDAREIGWTHPSERSDRPSTGSAVSKAVPSDAPSHTQHAPRSNTRAA